MCASINHVHRLNSRVLQRCAGPTENGRENFGDTKLINGSLKVSLLLMDTLNFLRE